MGLGQRQTAPREVFVCELHKVAGPPDPYLMLSLQDEVRKRKFELALMKSELASMEDRSISSGYANILQDPRVRMLTAGRPVRSGTIRPIPREALQPS